MRHPEHSRRLQPAIIALVVAFVIPFVYFAAYRINLDRKVYYFVGVDAGTGINRHRIEPSFHVLEQGSQIFFRPAFWIDGQLRSEYWDTVENKAAGKKWRHP